MARGRGGERRARREKKRGLKEEGRVHWRKGKVAERRRKGQTNANGAAEMYAKMAYLCRPAHPSRSTAPLAFVSAILAFGWRQSNAEAATSCSACSAGVMSSKRRRSGAQKHASKQKNAKRTQKIQQKYSLEKRSAFPPRCPAPSLNTGATHRTPSHRPVLRCLASSARKTGERRRNGLPRVRPVPP